VIDEANLETHGMKPYAGRLADDPRWKNAYMMRLSRMYYRDRNHPCVVGWSLGNEAGYGAVSFLCYACSVFRAVAIPLLCCYAVAIFYI